MNSIERERAAQRAPDPKLLDELRDLTDEQFRAFVRYHRFDAATVERLAWWIRHGWRYFERPVPVDRFLFSRAYMRAVDEHGHKFLWPEVVKAITAICEGDYVEAVLTGGIGVAKTTVALYVQAYELYRLLCQKNPHDVYGLDPATEILIVFQSLSLKLGTDVDYRRFRSMLERAPIFSDVHFKFDHDIKSKLVFPKNVFAQPVSGVEEGGLGQNIIGGIIDELASMAVVEKSAKTRNRKDTYDQAVALYSSIARRRESRFMDMGEMPGKLCLVSSKKYPDDFLHQKIEEAKDRPDRIFLYDKRVWDVKPWAFGKKRFRVFVGDQAHKPRVLEAREEAPDQDRVIDVPVEYLDQFRRDLLGALRDIAGYSALSMHPFMLDRDAIAACFGKVRPCVSREDCDFVESKLRIWPKRWEGTEEFWRWAHLDLSLTRDSCGLSVAHVPAFRRIQRSQVVKELLPIIRFDLVLEIVPPKGGEIQFEKIRRLLYLLRENGLPIRWVSADQFQSADMLQILATKGFEVGQESVDKNAGIYDVFKTAIYDGRVEAPLHEKARLEISRLERDPKTGKVDHPPGGSKDVSDSMATTAFGLSLMGEIWSDFGIDMREVPDTLVQAAEKEDRRAMEGLME